MKTGLELIKLSYQKTEGLKKEKKDVKQQLKSLVENISQDCTFDS